MTIKDYEEVYTLWTTIHGFGMRSLDDSKEGVQRFLQRNPSTSVVAVVKEENKEKIVGAILCGHDGRRGCFYHVCVDEQYRKRGIGKSMAVTCMKELQKEFGDDKTKAPQSGSMRDRVNQILNEDK